MRQLSFATLLAILGTAALGTSAQAPVAPKSPAAAAAAATVPATPNQAHPLTADDLEAFSDGIFPLQLERSDIAGASVLVMKDGNVLYEKGYGFADLKSSTPGSTA